MERQLDSAVDSVLRRFKPHLLLAARLCILSTFIEDSVRLMVRMAMPSPRPHRRRESPSAW